MSSASLFSPTAWSALFVRRVGQFLDSRWALLLAVALAFCLNIDSLPLSDVDEGAFSEATREMLERGNWISPILNGQPRHDKPVLIHWLQAASVTLFGTNEFAFRFPSLLAAIGWLGLLYRFCLRHFNRQTAQTATLSMALSLLVGLVARAAIADALLDLWLALIMFSIYDHVQAVESNRPMAEQQRPLWLAYGALGLGFMTKGPVTLLLPGLTAVVFLGSLGRWRVLFGALTFWRGWGLFIALILPWHVAVYLDQGDAFFRGFYLHHNLNRYASTFEGHGGNPLYYLAALPLIMMPFSACLVTAGRAVMRKTAPAGAAMLRFLICWFGVVFVFFSFSRTQLPHYLLYGITPLFILLGLPAGTSGNRLFNIAPAMVFLLLIALAPAWGSYLIPQLKSMNDRMLLAAFVEAFSGLPQILALAALAICGGLTFWRALPLMHTLLLVGYVQAAVVVGLLAPAVLAATQQPVKDAALFVREAGLPTVAWRVNYPSFSVYRQASTPSRLPLAGEAALTRTDRLDSLRLAVLPLHVETVFAAGVVRIVRVLPEGTQ